MFHAFHPASASFRIGENIKASTAPKPPALRKVNRSCFECTRRKIRCDGGQPCTNCRYYKVVNACGYRHRSQRHAASRNALEKASQELNDHKAVLKELFSDLDISSLKGKGRDQLLQVLGSQTRNEQERWTAKAGGSGMGTSQQTYLDSHNFEGHTLGPRAPRFQISTSPENRVNPEDDIDDSQQVSENGEEHDRQWDEVQTDPDASIKPSDDVNAVSLAYDQHRRSYLGVSSISAILRTIFRLCPLAKSNIAQYAKGWPKPLPKVFPATPTQIDTGRMDELRFIDAYFDHIHGITPMLNEAEFRSTWQNNNRADASWLALLNMVCTMGSIAAGEEHSHKLFHKNAQSYLNLETFGAGNIESLQALCLLGGYYLQYQNSPNMATALLGAAHRVAVALGLHRESRKSNPSVSSPDNSTFISRAEIRRRTWWSLFCLDTWSSMTMGRPTSGRWEQSSMDTRLPSMMDDSDDVALSLQASSEFCLIANRIQSRLAQLHRITSAEMFAFDQELQTWHSSLPSPLVAPHACSSRLVMARDFMHNRYLNLRLILYRPLLLYSSSGRNWANINHHVNQQEASVHHTCNEIAQQAVDSISDNWTPNRVHVWNASWYLFQATMVPLLSIAVGNSRRDDTQRDDVSQSKELLVKVLDLFPQMRPWMRSADRSQDIVRAIYEALSSTEPRRTPSVSDGDFNFFGWYDEEVTFGDEIDWSAFLVGDEELGFGNQSKN
ncbi:uncharacterized protein Z518_06573 [Rhinocladiella mackenziei CBS 650.93]|uniref:Zn(2)-C6 fungal-type domain-containing protein n=1 Tax=Rhinocladiella mackenziei CBS 650.93 TaxID=1442369 RepID=A0A0D2GXY4_9EURO|nr:uncharacterized protein Z518_06573 [Rhinocladiella mackenziei CBS 650.93]KIX03023.1 hypothetical protein Z518_06573 [Rhinocladiella mackenziei CBS 650.93]